MVGFKWKRTVVTAVACASLAWAQTSQSPSTPLVDKPRTMTVQELGKAPERCRVLRTWRETNGATVFEVQSLSSGERLTIVHSSASGSQSAGKKDDLTMRIYHWTGTMPPVGAPVAPPPAVATAPATTKPRAATTTVAKTTATAPVVTKTAAVVKATSVKPQPAAPADAKVAELANDTGRKNPTASQYVPLQVKPTSAVPPEVKTAKASDIAWKKSATQYVPAQVKATPAAPTEVKVAKQTGDTAGIKPATTQYVPAQVKPAPAEVRAAKLNGDAAEGKPASSQYVPVQVKQARSATTELRTAQLTDAAAAKKPAAAAAVTVVPAQPTDWHKSWGNSGEAKPRPAPVTTLPRADESRPDPLKEPQNYTRHGQDGSKPQGTATTVEPLPKSEKITLVPQPVATKPAQPQPAVPSKMPESKITAMPTVSTTTCMPCVVCPPKRTLLGWLTRVGTCKEQICEAAPVAQPAAPAPVPVVQGPPQHVDSLEIVKNSDTLVDVFKRLRSNPAGMPVVWTPMERGLTFQEKLENAMAESQARREARATLEAARKPAASPAEKTVVVKSTPTKAPSHKKENRPSGSQSVVAANDGMPAAPMPVPVMIIPPVRNPQALRPQRQEKPKTETVTIPRSEIENAFTEIEKPRAATNAAVGQSLPLEYASANAFVELPDNNPDGAFPQAMQRAMLQTLGMNPAYAYAPNGMGMPYGFNQAMAYGQPTAAIMPQAGMVPGPVYVTDGQERSAANAKAAQQPAMDVPHMLTLLSSALYPSHREWAADNLATLDPQQNPQVVLALLKSAREDTAATVRVGCVRGLGTMHANTPVVLATLQSLKSDAAQQVVQEADRVLGQLGASK